jgi:hypothetical protein
VSDSGEARRSHAEVVKLARLLERAPEQLEYLERIPPADLRALREQITDGLFSAQEAHSRGSRPRAGCYRSA